MISGVLEQQVTKKIPFLKDRSWAEVFTTINTNPLQIGPNKFWLSFMW